MHQPSRWWVGLVLVAPTWIAACLDKTGPIESDLSGEARAVAAAASPDTASALTIVGSGRDIMIDGPEFAGGQGAMVAQSVAQTTGVRQVSAQFTAVPTIKPYVFSAMRSGSDFVLAGSAPSPAMRAKLLDAAKNAASGATIVDHLEYGIGAPEGFEAIASHGLVAAAKLGTGAFSLSDKAYSIAGVAASSAIYEAVVASTQQLPAGATLTKADIQPPEAKPFVWSATYDGVAGTLSGVAPSIDARSAIARAATSSLPGKMIVDQMQIARGAPAGDFAAYAGYALTELGLLANGRVAISDGALSIVGEAGTSQAYDAALEAIKKLPPGLSIARADILAPEVKPFAWGAESDGKTVTLTGLAPSGTIRDGIAADAAKAFPGKTIVNQMGIARGAPTGDFSAMASSAFADLGKLASGKASLVDRQLSISGQGLPDVSSEAVAASASASLPAPFAIAAIDIKEAVISPYVFKAVKADGVVRLTGYAPDDKTRQDIVAAAKAAFISDTIEDDLKIGKGAPVNFVNAAKAAFPGMARLASGSVELSDGNATVDGLAVYDRAAEQIKQTLQNGWPAGFKFAAAHIGTAPPPPPLAVDECQPKFSGLLTKGQIQFETGSANLSKESITVLDGLVGLAMACGNADVEVAGHTDSVGAAASNLELSKRRAEAVVSFLEDAGVDVSRISAAGYGDTKPIAPNDTAEGRTQNRRIEFTVK